MLFECNGETFDTRKLLGFLLPSGDDVYAFYFRTTFKRVFVARRQPDNQLAVTELTPIEIREQADRYGHEFLRYAALVSKQSLRSAVA